MEKDIKKRCSVCKDEKLLDNFSDHKRYKYGKASVCKVCNSKQTIMYMKNKGVDKEMLKERSRLYRKNNHEKYKLSLRLSSYKRLGLTITKDEYKQMYLEQDGKCKICKNPPLSFKKSLCLDHCHVTLKVRGLLCDNCNAGLGKFKDDIKILLSAINYLKDNI